MSYRVKFITNQELSQFEEDIKIKPEIVNKIDDCTLITERDMKEVFEQLCHNKKNKNDDEKTMTLIEFKDILKRQCKIDIKSDELKLIFNNKETIAFKD